MICTRISSSQVPLFSRSFSTKPSIDLAKIFIFPIKKGKHPYVYFKYNEELVNSSSTIVKYENKLITLAAKGWKTLQDSDKSYNKKIVHYINKLLEQTPWVENSLLSFPSQSALLKQVKLHNNEKGEEKLANKLSPIYELENIKHDLIKIPVYYPKSIIEKSKLTEELLKLTDSSQSFFKKKMIINALLLPLTAPLILLPIVPNVPGFYLCYRFYCNLKASLGASHLKEMISQNELEFVESNELDTFYENSANETLFINEQTIEKIVESFETQGIKTYLIKALKQESHSEQGKSIE